MKKIAVLFWFFCLFVSVQAHAYQEAQIWSFWDRSNEENLEPIDHSDFDVFLKKYVSLGYINKLRYKDVSQEDKERLNAYIDRLAATPIRSYSKQQQLFFWINLHNAYVIKTILDQYPIASIEDVDLSPELFREGPWVQKILTLDGERVSLKDIQNLILRPIWRDWRVLYTLHTGHLSAPHIQPFAYTVETFDAHIDAIIRDYINHPHNVAVSDDGLLTLSSFYDWYSGDFGEGEAFLLDHLIKYAAPPLQEKLKSVDSVVVYDFDFSLNEELMETPQQEKKDGIKNDNTF